MSSAHTSIKDEKITCGVEVKHGLGYKCSGRSIITVMDTPSLHHAIISFLGPLSTYALSFVLWNRYIWLYSWVGQRVYPPISNGVSTTTRNVFIRYSLSIEETGSNEDLNPENVIHAPGRPRSLLPDESEEIDDTKEEQRREEKTDSHFRREGEERRTLEGGRDGARSSGVSIESKLHPSSSLPSASPVLPESSLQKQVSSFSSVTSSSARSSTVSSEWKRERELMKIMPVFDESFFDVPRCKHDISDIVDIIYRTYEYGYCREPGDEEGDERYCFSNSLTSSSCDFSDYFDDDDDDVNVEMEIDYLNILPNERSTIIDHRREDREKLWIARRLRDARPIVERDTHFFDCHLIPLDMDKVLRKVASRNHCNIMLTEICSSFRDEAISYGPLFGYWLWLETGYTVSSCLRICEHEGVPIPLDVFFWSRSMNDELKSYGEFMESRVPSTREWRGKSDFKDAKKHMRDFCNLCWGKIQSVPAWYLMELGAITLGDLVPKPIHVAECTDKSPNPLRPFEDTKHSKCIKYDYIELFLKNGFVRNVQDLEGIAPLLSYPIVFKLVEKYVRISYEDILLMSRDNEYGSLGPWNLVKQDYKNTFRSLADILHIEGEYPNSSIPRRRIRIASLEIVNDFVKNGRLEEILPHLEINLGSGKYTQVCIDMRLQYLCYLFDEWKPEVKKRKDDTRRGAEILDGLTGGSEQALSLSLSLPSLSVRGEEADSLTEDDSEMWSEDKLSVDEKLEMGDFKVQSTLLVEFIEYLLIFCDPLQVSISDEKRWLLLICKYVSILYMTRGKCIAISMLSTRSDKIKAVLKGTMKSKIDVSLGEMLKLFIRGVDGIPDVIHLR